MAAKKLKVSGHQLEALRAAQGSGFLRRLPGGFWVKGDYPDVPKDQTHTPKVWLSTHTIQACSTRGWLTMPNYYTALLNDEGRNVVASNADVSTFNEVRDHNRLSEA